VAVTTIRIEHDPADDTAVGGTSPRSAIVTALPAVRYRAETLSGSEPGRASGRRRVRWQRWSRSGMRRQRMADGSTIRSERPRPCSCRRLKPQLWQHSPPAAASGSKTPSMVPTSCASASRLRCHKYWWSRSTAHCVAPARRCQLQRHLVAGALGNFRDLLEAVTLHPAMGAYLSMLVTGSPMLRAISGRTRIMRAK